MHQIRSAFGARFDLKLWSHNLKVLAVTVFLVNFGQGLFRGASTNFFVDTLGLEGTQVLWLAGLCEIPGLLLVFIAAAIMHFALPRRAALALVLMGLGYGLYALVNSFTALVAMSLLAGYLLATVGYEGLCWGAAAVIGLSIPFALAITTDGHLTPATS